MSDFNNIQSSNRISVCPLSNKGRRMKLQDKDIKEECINDLKRGEQVYAVKGYSEQRTKISLTFLEGDIITVLDQFSDGMCKGYISRLGPDSKVGIFPATCVVPFTKNNINSINPNVRKCSKKIIESKEKDRSFNSPVAIRDKEKLSPIDAIPRTVNDMYNCNYIEIRNSQITNTKVSLPVESINRGSTCSVDSGRGSTTVTIMNSIKMNKPLTPLSTFDQAQHIPENYVSNSIESGLASYQRHSSSSSSSIDDGSSIDGSRQNCGFIDIQHRQTLNTTLEEEERVENNIKNWLQNINLEIYTSNFINAGYDFNTLLRMTPEDINAIGITNPKHRKLIKNEISNTIGSILDNPSESLPASVEEWLTFLNLSLYLELVLQQGYDKVGKLTNITWEDLEEIGIRKLGHQKKIILAVEKLKKIIKNLPNDKLPISYSAENFRDPKSKFTISDTSPKYRAKCDDHNANPAYLDLSRFNSIRPILPVRLVQQPDLRISSHSNILQSPNHMARCNTDSSIPPPTPKRISSIMSSPVQILPSPQKSKFRKPYENMNESIDTIIKSSKIGTNIHDDRSQQMSSDFDISQFIKPDFRFRSSSIMLTETHGLPFANENCGTIKQRSSSLDRNDVLREEIEFGVIGMQSNISSNAKPVLPLTLPYIIDSFSYKQSPSSQKVKVTNVSERSIQVIPSDVHIAVREKVPLPKLHMEDNSSNEDFNEICDMLEDLTELLDKEVSRNH